MHCGLRVFAPVGQGAFYYERLAGKSFVYDCGTASDKEYLSREIKNAFAEGEEIEAIFLSHMHKDHYSGLFDLLKRCKVRRLYLPLLSDEQILINAGHAFADGLAARMSDSDLRRNIQLILDPISVLREESPATKLFLVEPIHIYIYWDDRVASYRISNMWREGGMIGPNGGGARLVSSGDQQWLCGSVDDFDWVFVPMNFDYASRSRKLLDALKSQGLRPEDVVDAFKSNKFELLEKASNAYREVAQNPNNHTMVVYSGPAKSGECTQWEASSLCGGGLACRRCAPLPAGCLYLGDYPAKAKRYWSSLVEALDPYLDMVGCLQVPHHGSAGNFRKDMVDPRWVSVVSAGHGRSHHPAEKVVREYCESGCVLRIVTELERTAATFLIRDK